MGALDSLASRLPEGSVSTHPGEVASRARDWWALAMLRERRGDAPTPPLAVVFARSTEDVATALAWAQETETPVVTRGGGSGVCGGALAVRGGIVLDVSGLSEVLSIDEESLAVEVQAGVRGDALEEALDERGLTLGHYPQSLAISTVGGWIAARSAGAASAGYGVIEDLLLGLTAVLAGGRVLRLRATPRSAAGPDLRRLFAGSEGALGVVTEATLSVSRRPAGLRWLAFTPPGFGEAAELARRVVQRGLHPLVVRAYDEPDAGVTFGPIGHEGGAALIIALPEGSPGLGGMAAAVAEEATAAGADPLSPDYGAHWWEHRMDAVDLYRRIVGEERAFGEGAIVDTMEVAGLWSRLPELYRAVREAIAGHAEAVGCHLSHPYRSGASLYFTFMIRGEDDRDAERRYLACWADAVRACHRRAGTMTHHHGVGLLKAAFLGEELGAEALEALRGLKRALDPLGLLNPGKLLPDA